MIFCSPLSNEFPSGEKWVKHSASLDVAVTLFRVDYGTTLTDYELEDKSQGGRARFGPGGALGIDLKPC